MQRLLVVATAILSTTLNPLIATPAFADVVDAAVQTELDAQCQAQLQPADQSDFTAVAQNIVAGQLTGAGLSITDYNYATHHGGSVNIFANVDYVITGGSTQYTYDCYVSKIVGHDTVVDPAGLQTFANIFSIANDDEITGSGDILICISPLRNPGVWRPANGYDGQLGSCSTTLYVASGGNTPSVSVPNYPVL